MVDLPGGLARFNGASPEDALATAMSCAAVPRWAREVTAGRPYPDVAAALERARGAAVPFTDDEVDAALARHPRIGQRPTTDGRDAEHSRREQAGVGDDPELARRLEEGNRRYEDRFGHVFLIRAAGRDAAQILAALEERLGNDPATERRVAAEQLREIAVLRLEGELS